MRRIQVKAIHIPADESNFRQPEQPIQVTAVGGPAPTVLSPAGASSPAPSEEGATTQQAGGAPQSAPLPPEPEGLTPEGVLGRYGWVTPPEQGWPVPPATVAALLNIPVDVLAFMATTPPPTRKPAEPASE